MIEKKLYIFKEFINFLIDQNLDSFNSKYISIEKIIKNKSSIEIFQQFVHYCTNYKLKIKHFCFKQIMRIHKRKTFKRKEK